MNLSSLGEYQGLSNGYEARQEAALPWGVSDTDLRAVQ